MKYQNLIVFILLNLSCLAQNSLVRINIDELNTLKSDEFYTDYLKVPYIEDSIYSHNFKYSLGNKTVYLFSKDGIHFTGKYVEHLIENKVKIKVDREHLTPINHVYMINELPSEKSDSVGQYIINNHIYSIPTDTNIKYWNFEWDDCRSNHLQVKIDSQRFYKSYSCLKNQEDSIEYVTSLKQFNQFVKRTLNLKGYYILSDKLKPNRRYTDGFLIITIRSKSRRKRFRKNINRIIYIDSMLDSIDTHIESQLNVLIPDKVVNSYTSDYQITISSKKRLKRVKVRMNFWERFANLEYIKWKKQIRKAFRKIDLSFIQDDLSIKFKRDLTISKRGIEVYNPMILYY